MTHPFIETLNWTEKIDEHGQPRRNPAKDATIDGVLVSPSSGGASNWPAPSFDPETKLFYVSTAQNYSMFYLTDTDPHPEGYGAAEKASGGLGNALRALDYQTGKTVWKHDFPGNGTLSGLLTTAGKLLFAGDGLSTSSPSTPPAERYSGTRAWVQISATVRSRTCIDNKQYVLVGAGDSLYSFALAE